MSILLNDEALCCGARRLAVQLAAALPAPEDGFSPAFQADMTALTRCVTRRQAVRRWGRRAAAAALTALLTFGAVLAASPVARAAVSRWFVQITELVTAYRITPADAGDTVQDYTPTAPLGYVLSGDFTGRENGIRVMRWTSSQGDLLFEAVPMTGDEPISVELRSSSTGGLFSTETRGGRAGGLRDGECDRTRPVRPAIPHIARRGHLSAGAARLRPVVLSGKRPRAFPSGVHPGGRCGAGVGGRASQLPVPADRRSVPAGAGVRGGEHI